MFLFNHDIVIYCMSSTCLKAWNNFFLTLKLSSSRHFLLVQQKHVWNYQMKHSGKVGKALQWRNVLVCASVTYLRAAKAQDDMRQQDRIFSIHHEENGSPHFLIPFFPPQEIIVETLKSFRNVQIRARLQYYDLLLGALKMPN